jgi:hypothetical protein
MVKAAVETGWHGFTGRVIEVEDVEVPGMAVRPVRFKVKLAYKRKPYGTLPMEVAAPEGAALGDVDRVVVAPLDPVGLPAPEAVSCLSIRYQIAQKLHACTDTFDGEKPNDRAHDLADLILLEELVEDSALTEVRSACIETFGLRNRQSWPPALVVPQHWPALWALVVEEDRFPVESLEEAAARVRALIARIDAG